MPRASNPLIRTRFYAAFMVAAIVQISLATVLAEKTHCAGDATEQIACGWTASLRAEGLNCSFQCGIEDEDPDETFNLLQVGLRVSNNTTISALSILQQGHPQAKQITNKSAKQTILLQSNASLNSSAEGNVSRSVSLVLDRTSQRSNQQLSGVAFVIAVVCVMCLTGCIMMCSFDELDYATDEKPRQAQRPVQRNSPQGAPIGSPIMSGTSNASGPKKASSAGFAAPPQGSPGAQALSPVAPNVGLAATSSAASPVVPALGGPNPFGRGGTPPQSSSATPVAPLAVPNIGSHGAPLQSGDPPPTFGQGSRNMQMQTSDQYPPQTPMKMQTPPFGTPSGIGGIPMICPSMVLQTDPISLTTSGSELVRMATTAYTQQLDFRNPVSGKTMLIAKIENGRNSLVIYNAKEGHPDLPRAFIHMRGPGEPCDVFGPRERQEVYGSLAFINEQGVHKALLTYRGHPFMRITKFLDVPQLYCVCSTMDDKEVAEARPPENNSSDWTLNVKPGSDSVLMLACMMGLLIFGRST